MHAWLIQLLGTHAACYINFIPFLLMLWMKRSLQVMWHVQRKRNYAGEQRSIGVPLYEFIWIEWCIYLEFRKTFSVNLVEELEQLSLIYWLHYQKITEKQNKVTENKINKKTEQQQHGPNIWIRKVPSTHRYFNNHLKDTTSRIKLHLKIAYINLVTGVN